MSKLRGNPSGLGCARRLAYRFRIEIDAANASGAGARYDQREGSPDPQPKSSTPLPAIERGSKSRVNSASSDCRRHAS